MASWLCRRMSTNGTRRPPFEILFHDGDLIALSKPANVLSTPGREMRIKPVSRADEWAAAISELCLLKRQQLTTEVYDNAMEVLRNQAKVVPRQKPKFLSFLERVAKIKDQSTKEQIWEDLTKLDSDLHAVDTSALPSELYSAADFARDVCGKSIHHVHRLDQETSGLILFAKSTFAASELARQFRDREIEKTYIALVHGHVPKDSPSLIDVPLSADETCKPKQKVDWSENGKQSQTIMKVIDNLDPSYSQRLRYFPTIPAELPFSMIQLQPQTGRTHQLRMHMLHLGFPMIGDSLYAVDQTSEPFERLCLHAESISFVHPTSQLRITLTDNKENVPSSCELPEDGKDNQTCK